METIDKIKQNLKDNVNKLYQIDLEDFDLDFPPNENMGDYAFACFELAEKVKSNPAEVAKKLAADFSKNDLVKEVKNFGPYLNIFVSDNFLSESINKISQDKKFGQNKIGKGQKILIEFSGPNTNKPQHVGHLRNNCIGQSLVNIFKNNGYKTIAVNIINDRGIHIIKSMLAWQEFGQNETPESSGLKGDHLVGKYYVKFGQLLKEEQEKYYQAKNIDINKLDNITRKKTEEEFLAQSKWMQKARAMLIAWENNDPAVKKLWQMMNSWVYKGYDKTYKDLGIEFDHLDFESENYLLGKEIINQGLRDKVFYKKADGSVWVDLSKDGLDEKLLLRSDGTSVYITQDLGTASKRYKKFKFDKSIYVVANEQEYHFKVLFLTLQKMGYQWADKLYHLSYGMVSLPGGKIKSREGKTADADDLMVKMTEEAKNVMNKANKKVAATKQEKEESAKIVGLGALKFFMISSAPSKNIVFKPEESISFDGYTATFIQYTHARISNVLAKSKKINKTIKDYKFNAEEAKLIKLVMAYPMHTLKAGENYNPSIISQYLFELAKAYNHFYQKHSILEADKEEQIKNRIQISILVQKTIKDALALLGIAAPDKM